MTVFYSCGIFSDYKYIFVITAFGITIIIAVLFDYFIKKIDKIFG